MQIYIYINSEFFCISQIKEILPFVGWNRASTYTAESCYRCAGSAASSSLLLDNSGVNVS